VCSGELVARLVPARVDLRRDAAAFGGNVVERKPRAARDSL
jgi:hypothetical protein